MNETIKTGKIVGLASEGQGIVREEGLVTFLPFTAKNEIVNYKITQRKKNFAIGKLLQVVEKSPERITPLCPYYQICGGCQLQHINYEAQIEYKRQWIEDALKKIGKFQNISIPPLTPAYHQWGYRRKIHLLLKPHKNAFQAGYIAIDHESLVPIQQCPIFTHENDPIIPSIQKICNELIPNDSFDAKVTILKNDQGYIIHFHFRKMPENCFNLLSSSIKAYPFIRGILATSKQKTFQFGIIEAVYHLDDLTFNFTPQTFIQNHPEQSLNIYKAIESIGKKFNPTRILDLYCGIGISSLLLAKQVKKITGVELNPQAIKLANDNAKKNHLTHTEFITGDVEKVLAKLIGIDLPDFIIVNPPREGLSTKVTQALCSRPAKTLIYISCMPPTLARDLQRLCEKDYKIASIQAFDMFPQTVHVETLVVLSS